MIADAALHFIISEPQTLDLHHWLLTSRSLAIFCLFSLFHILDLLSPFLRIAFLLEADSVVAA